MEPPLPDSILVDFLGRLLADRAAGAANTLADYQALYPGHERAVQAEYLRATTGSRASVASTGASQGRASPAARMASPAAGDAGRVAHYRLVRELGRGGQGTVWLAHDERLERPVALKLVPRSPLVEDLAPRFRREAQLAGRVEHPGLCAVYDVGFDDAVAWLALRYVEGTTLARRLADGPLPREQALALIEGAARALHAAHEAGILHRDVKPGNLMITPGGEAVVLDFGVARPDEDGPPLTLTGDALGTPAYMAPEQLGSARASRGSGAPRLSPERRSPDRRVPDRRVPDRRVDDRRVPDRRVDVWALGVTLHEALLCRRPFEAPTREGLVHAILTTEPDLPAGLGRDLCVVLRTALCKDLDRRYRTALDLAEDLRRVRRHEPILARPAGPIVRLLSWGRRNPGLAASLGALAVVVLGALVVTGSLLAETRATLADVTRLSDQKVTRDLLDEQRTLWPAEPERLAAMEAWLAAAQPVLAREAQHRQALAEAAAGSGITDAWMHEQLAQLLPALDELRAAVSSVQARMDFARSVGRLTLEEPHAAWEAAAAAVGADPRFEGLALRPQSGLVPLGADRDSHLQEFAVLQTGVVPTRDAGTGKLAIDEASAVVLVLVPGGLTHVGATPETDAWCGRWDGPIQTLRLDPFLLSRFEMTQGQWQRHTGSNPSTYGPGSRLLDAERPLQHPVEGVTWADADRVTRELGLTLPTEAQWEHAARAGTTTPWWTGAEPESLAGAADLADDYARTHGGHDAWKYVDWMDDGFTAHAPVGSYAANAFGLHDVIGNVSEWCLDTWEDWDVQHPRDGDGFCSVDETAHNYRGGGFLHGPAEARSSTRNGGPPAFFSYYVGLRPARALER